MSKVGRRLLGQCAFECVSRNSSLCVCVCVCVFVCWRVCLCRLYSAIDIVRSCTKRLLTYGVRPSFFRVCVFSPFYPSTAYPGKDAARREPAVPLPRAPSCARTLGQPPSRYRRKPRVKKKNNVFVAASVVVVVVVADGVEKPHHPSILQHFCIDNFTRQSALT